MRVSLPSLIVACLLLASPAAAESKSERILEQLARISETLNSSKYNHATIVDERSGRYEFDCSGLVTWVLRRAAPGAHASMLARSKRPLARDYYYELSRAPLAERTPRGVRRVARVADAEPGDIVAWLKPSIVQSPNTGHVAFLLERPRSAPGIPNGYLVRIADASQYQHDDDDRYGSGRTGFGTGTILLLADEVTGAPTAYGWFGLRSGFALYTDIALGRVTR
jgi:cell wall-associated NlpC family hydrolase